jgi:drug/metabolite transporter (DMT)-like permease
MQRRWSCRRQEPARGLRREANLNRHGDGEVQGSALLLWSVWLGCSILEPGLGFAAVHLSQDALRLPSIEAPLHRSDTSWLALVILTGGMLGSPLPMFGLARTDAAGTSLLLNLEGVATVGIAWVAFHESVDRRPLLGILAILARAVLLSRQGQASFQWGALLIAGACVCWCIDNNLTHKLPSADPLALVEHTTVWPTRQTAMANSGTIAATPQPRVGRTHAHYRQITIDISSAY